ncbi:MAG: hypothetical protein ACOCQ9_00380 [Candidatus Brocadiia bacterium]
MSQRTTDYRYIFVLTRTMTTMLFAVMVLMGVAAPAMAQQASQTWDFRNYEDAFELGEDQEATDYQVTVLDSNAPGHIFGEDEQPEFKFQIENLTDEPLEAEGKVELIRYGTFEDPDYEDSWWEPTIEKYEDVAEIPLQVDLEAGDWTNVTIEPPTPETRGGYALIVDLGDYGRRYLASFIRTFEHDLERVQFPVQSLEHHPPEILARLGVQAIRYGVSFEPLDTDRTKDGKPYFDWLDEQFQDLHDHKITAMAEVGVGDTYKQPLGQPRPHLDEDDVMKGGKKDSVWLPEEDDEFEEYVYHLASNYGWPKGPITGITLWNEPWEGSSISGWQADMIRYRELHRRMGEAVFRAREEHDVEVLIGGADSTSNTWDKFLPQGTENSPLWPEYVDFCSIHYQGMSAPSRYKAWNEREHYMGRVKVWDTESWLANSEDSFVSVFASNRAAGYDRTMGSLSRYAVSSLSHGRVRHDTIQTEDGEKKIRRPLETRPLGATYSAVRHFFGERDFDRVLFKKGLPWVFVFDGLDGNPDDGTVAITGDIQSLYRGQPQLFDGVRTLDEVEAKSDLRDELDALEPDQLGRRAELYAKLAERHSFRDATIRIDNPDGLFKVYDQYGNVAQDGETLDLVLDTTGHILRADPEESGSFDKLLDAIRSAEIRGIQPLEIVARDMTNEIKNRPTVELRLTNQLNQSVEGSLDVSLGELEISHPDQLSFEPRERKRVEIEVVGGEPRDDNTYPLAVDFDAGEQGLAPHREDMHVNLINRRTITVDGDLDDWEGTLPQTINAVGDLDPTMTEEAWLPFEDFEEGISTGFATAYVAYDEDYFYFAARVADDDPVPAPVRFGEQDDDFYFYPEVSYEETDDGEQIEHRWPEDVRRFSYRRQPDLPSSGQGRNFDNILIGFNVLEPGEDNHTIRSLPGRPERLGHYKTTDYQLALNKVSDEAGGGTEVYMLETPNMPRKHHYPRQPEHPDEGPVEGAELEVVYHDDTRIVEAAIPWSAIPTVHQRMKDGDQISFSYRVNHGGGGPAMELSKGRSAAEGLSKSFNPDWQRSYPNVLPFEWE